MYYKGLRSYYPLTIIHEKYLYMHTKRFLHRQSLHQYIYSRIWMAPLGFPRLLTHWKGPVILSRLGVFIEFIKYVIFVLCRNIFADKLVTFAIKFLRIDV